MSNSYPSVEDEIIDPAYEFYAPKYFDFESGVDDGSGDEWFNDTPALYEPLLMEFNVNSNSPIDVDPCFSVEATDFAVQSINTTSLVESQGTIGCASELLTREGHACNQRSPRKRQRQDVTRPMSPSFMKRERKIKRQKILSTEERELVEIAEAKKRLRLKREIPTSRVNLTAPPKLTTARQPQQPANARQTQLPANAKQTQLPTTARQTQQSATARPPQLQPTTARPLQLHPTTARPPLQLHPTTARPPLQPTTARLPLQPTTARLPLQPTTTRLPLQPTTTTQLPSTATQQFNIPPHQPQNPFAPLPRPLPSHKTPRSKTSLKRATQNENKPNTTTHTAPQQRSTNTKQIPRWR